MVTEDYVGTGIAWGLTFGIALQDLLVWNKGLLKPDLELLMDGDRFTSGIEKRTQTREQWPMG